MGLITSATLLIAVMLGLTALAAVGDVNTLLYNALKATDGTIVGMTTTTLATSSSGAPLWESTKAFGKAGRAQTSVMSLDTCVGLNTMAELLVTVAAIQLLAEVSFTSSLDDQISAALSPTGAAMTNPNNGQSITYRQLLQHTSTIVDSTFYAYTATSGTVSDLATFVTAYFGTSTAPNFAAYSSATPGASAAFSFARANIALMAYILDRVCAGTTYGTLKNYVATTILQPLGMSSTFFLSTSGVAPGITTIPSFSGTYAAGDPSTSYTSLFSGCIGDQMGTTVPLHPAYWADFMGYTTPLDVARLLRGLFYTTAFTSAVTSMRQSIVTVATSAARVPGQTAQGLGLARFNGDTVASLGLATGVIAASPVDNSTNIFGYVTARNYTQMGWLCAVTSSSTYGTVCSITTVLHSSASQRSGANVLAVAAAAFQDLVGTVVVAGATTAPSPSEQADSEWFGAYCFIAVYCSIMAVYFMTSFLQWLLQPAALAANTDTGAATGLEYRDPNASPQRRSGRRDLGAFGETPKDR